MKYRVIERCTSFGIEISIQVKRWFGVFRWITFKTFEVDYDDNDEYEYYVSEANDIIELLNRK